MSGDETTTTANTAYCKARYASDPEYRRRRIEASAAYRKRARQDPEKGERLRAREREYGARRRRAAGVKARGPRRHVDDDEGDDGAMFLIVALGDDGYNNM